MVQADVVVFSAPDPRLALYGATLARPVEPGHGDWSDAALYLRQRSALSDRVQADDDDRQRNQRQEQAEGQRAQVARRRL